MLNTVILGLQSLRKKAFCHKNNHRFRINKEKLKEKDLNIPLTTINRKIHQDPERSLAQKNKWTSKEKSFHMTDHNRF